MIPNKDDTISEIKPFDRILADAKAEAQKINAPNTPFSEICRDCGIDHIH